MIYLNKIYRILSVSLLFFFLGFHFVSAKLGEWSANLYMSNEKGPFKRSAADGSLDMSSLDLANFVGAIIWVGPFLGIIFIMQMVMAGYEWMTASGDGKKVEDAKKRIQHAVIGLIIFISLYTLAVFIVTSLMDVAGYTGEGK